MSLEKQGVGYLTENAKRCSPVKRVHHLGPCGERAELVRMPQEVERAIHDLIDKARGPVQLDNLRRESQP